MDTNEFLVESERTLSGKFFSERIDSDAFYSLVEDIEFAGAAADKVKKYLYYGRDPEGYFAFDPTDDTASVKETLPNLDPEFFHAALGVYTEAVEMLQAVFKAAEKGEEVDKVNFMEEIGDAMFYMALGVRQCGTTFEHVMDRNIAKLKARYPDKFTLEAAECRDLATERKILEG